MIRIHILTEEEKNLQTNLTEIRVAEKEKLTQLIENEKSGWFKRANERLETFRKAKSYNEASGIWSEIKEVYMRLQFHKCAYCEQKLEDKNIVHDVEHYRPKKNVRVWLNDERIKILGFDFNDTENNGYYLLPYNIFNYVTTCKHCNSSLKSDYFPIAGARKNDSEAFDEINSQENPFLIYPFGYIEEYAPEELLTFDGVLPIPHPSLTDDYLIKRVKVTIAFFDLATLRETLIEERCEVIKGVLKAVDQINESTDKEKINEGKDELKIYCSPSSRHANCANSYLQLCLNNEKKAIEIAKEAHKYLCQRRL
jgi:hypothetical protein